MKTIVMSMMMLLIPFSGSAYFVYDTEYHLAHPEGGTSGEVLGDSIQLLTQDLYLGVKHPEVQLLQEYLNAQGFAVSQTGPGSRGQETTYFGRGTMAALIRYQEMYVKDILAPHGLTKGTGAVYARTRDHINTRRKMTSMMLPRNGAILSINTGEKYVSPSTRLSFFAQGGVAPYTWWTTGGTLQITGTATVALTAPKQTGTLTVILRDSVGNTATTSLTVVTKIMQRMVTTRPGKTITLHPQGGAKPYIFTLTTGGGVLTETGKYTAPVTEGTSFILITDQVGQTRSVRISVSEKPTTTMSTTTSTADTVTATTTTVSSNPTVTGTNGMCGSAQNVTYSVAPTSNLCSVGTPSLVNSGSLTYTWSCLGSNGGATASCSAYTSGGASASRTFYISDCQAGAQASCVAGTSTNDGLSPATPKRLWSELPATKNGGDKFLFAKGGSWVDASMNIMVRTATAQNPATWDSYTPPWGGSVKPILTESRSKYLFNFNDGGTKDAQGNYVSDGGYLIRNLDLRGGGVFGGARGGLAGIFLYYAVDNVTMENLEIRGFNNGVYSAHNPHAAGGWENHNIVLRNSYVHDNLTGAWLGGAQNMRIENNKLEHNGSTAIFDHNIYVSSAENSVIQGNTISRTALDASGKCGGSVIVTHGYVDNLIIEGNTIIEPKGIPQCFGIEVSGGYGSAQPPESFSNVKIRKNRVVDVGYIGIGLRNCRDCVVENNAIVWTGDGASQGISMSVNAPGTEDVKNSSLTIRNNSVYTNGTNANAKGISLVSEGSGHSITSNILYYGTAAPQSVACFDVNTHPLSDFTRFDNNLCFRAGGTPLYSNAYTTLAAAQSAGFDTHGVSLDPQFSGIPSTSNGYSLALLPSSPAINSGNSAAPSDDLAGSNRDASPDIGAYEY